MNNIETSIVRIFNSNGQAIGVGFLVSQKLVMTCAHVILTATKSMEVGVSLKIDMPLIAPEEIISGHVVFFEQEKDISCLEIDGTLPHGATPAKLITKENLWGHTFRVFGFPSGYENGVWSSGVLRSSTGEGWLQIEDVKDTGFSIQPGFSGGPVWDDKFEGVVGMVSAAEMDRTIKAAFCIPIRDLIYTFPKLRDNIGSLCPYRSLDAFSEEDQYYFFGRERVITKLIGSMKKEPRYLALLGPSGSGKSSVVRAGLIPALREGKVPGSDNWYVMTIRPSTQPFAQLENAGLANMELGLEASVKLWISNNFTTKRLVIFIDQFEELLVSTPSDIRKAFVNEISQLLDSSLPITIILTLRDDFYSRFQQEAIPLASLFEGNLVNIPPVLEKDELQAIITKPAEQVGIEFEEGLVDIIISDAIEIDRNQEYARSTILPLLEFALTQVWEKRQGNKLTHHAYHSISGVGGGLSQWADQAYHDLHDEERKIAQHLLSDLVNLGDEAQGIPNTKRIRDYDELIENESSRGVAQKLIQARLLVASYDIGLQQNRIELIHEALIYKWRRLAGWLEENKEYLRIFNQFTESAKDWERAGRDSGLLYRGARLSKLIQWLEVRNNETLSFLEKEFLQDSVLQDKKLEQILRILTEISSHLDIDRVFDRILVLINEAVGAEQGTIMLFNTENKLLHFHAGYDYLSDRATEKKQSLKIGEGLAGWVVEHREAAVINDLSLDARWTLLNSSFQDYQSAIAVPLLTDKNVIGVLLVFHSKPNYFRGELLGTVRPIADQIAIAVENARLYQSTVSTAERFRILNTASYEVGSSLDPEQIYVAVHRAAKQLMPADVFVISLLDEETGEIVGVYLVENENRAPATRIKGDQGLSGRVISTGMPLLLNTAEKLDSNFSVATSKGTDTPLSILAVPMTISGKAVGILSAQSFQQNVYSEDDLQILSTLANQAAVALENARLFTLTDQELTARVQELQVMGRIVRELNASLEVERAMRITLEWAIRQSSAEAGLIGMLEEDFLHLMAYQGYEDVIDDRISNRLPLDLPAIRDAINTAQSKQISLLDDGKTGLLPAAHTQIIVPIRREAQVIGLILLESTNNSLINLDFLNRLSDNAAIAISNARLYDEVQRANLGKSDFVSFVAHELKNPMTSIKGYTELLAAGSVGQINEMQTNFLGTIRANVERMSALVSDLNDNARIEVGRLRLDYKPVDIPDIVDEVVRSAKRQVDDKRQDVELQLPPQLPQVWADRTRVGQVLTNLISNAHKYTPEGGKILVGAEATRNQWDPEGAKQVVHLWVKDNGIGISIEDQAKYFQKFFRSDDPKAREAPGVGLGLSISKSLVEMMGGRIWFDSEFRKGTTVHFTIPIAEG